MRISSTAPTVGGVKTTILAEAAPAKVAARPRVVGIDIARGLAVLGMITAHTIFGAVDTTTQQSRLLAEVVGWANGRPAVMFVLLAGISLGFITGAPKPYDGRAAVNARLKVFARSMVLLVLVGILALLNTPVILILAYYAVWFVFALPFVRLSARALFAIAGVMSVVGPALLWGFGMAQDAGLVPSASSLDGTVQSALVSGTYPGLAFLPIMLVGLRLSRLNLAALRTQVTLLVTGVLLASGAYSVAAFLYPQLVPDTVLSVQQEEAKAASFSYEDQSQIDKGVAGNVPDSEIQIVEENDAALAAAVAQYQEDHGAGAADTVGEFGDGADGNGMSADGGAMGEDYGPAPSFTHWSYLLQAKPHTGMPMDVAGCVGVALAVLALCLMMPRWVARVFAPVAAVGSMALTAYVAHVIVISAVPELVGVPSLYAVAAFLAGITLACWAWKVIAGRGPLERLMAWASRRMAAEPEAARWA